MAEVHYYDVPSRFPTLARGLFTREIPGDSQEDGKVSTTSQIVARGYDKFFDIGEVPWTTWSSIEAHTVGPYTLSLKSNGAIILIAALTPSKLVVTSKHSTGLYSRRGLSHAQVGETWLKKHLETKGKTEADLASRLWESNLTAVAELCDDSYEEHILAHPPEKTGLHLHGLNVRSKEFITLSTDLVDAFAEEWGFIKTPTLTYGSIQEVKDFVNTCAETGKWNGEAVEGFVVRTHVAELPPSNTGIGRDLTLPPYKAGSSLFFKVKFDEPYMMYRDWREVTKIMLNNRNQLKTSKLPVSKMKRAETKVYAKWVVEQITKDRASFKGFNTGKGIIATREKFLEFLKTEQGIEELAAVKNGNEKGVPAVATDEVGKTIILTVGIPGIGKTSVSLALAHIFEFGHVQSNDVYSNRYAPFIRDVFFLLRKNNVVIADKNNHVKALRQSLRDASARLPVPIRYVALNWSLDQQPPAAIHRICSDRVQQQLQKCGDNPQTVPADSSSESTEDLIWLYINSTQELAPSEVDNIVEMKLGESLEESVKRAVEGCVAALGLEMPSDEKIQEGLEIAKNYVPTEENFDSPIKKNRAVVQYYGILPGLKLEELLDPIFAKEDEANKEFWTQLKTDSRITRRPHLTIVHRNAFEKEGDLWNRCAAVCEMPAPVSPTFKGTLSNVVWDGRVMAIAVDDFDLASASSESNEGRELLSNLSNDNRSRLFITVGTRNAKIRAADSSKMIRKWRSVENLDRIKSIKLADPPVLVYGKIKGLMH